jgi:hypothetical protein
MGSTPLTAMLASLNGSFALAIGLAVMLLPLLSPELSRPRDAAWGAVLLLLGLVLITAADRLSGSPMLAVLCGGLLIGRLGGEVVQGRWRQLTPEEQQRLLSLERWQSSLRELSTTMIRSAGALNESLNSLTAVLGPGRSRGRTAGTNKRWVRPEPVAAEPGVTGPAATLEQAPELSLQTAADAPASRTGAEGASTPPVEVASAAAVSDPSVAEAIPVEDLDPATAETTNPAAEPRLVTSFAEIEALIQASSGEAG